MQINLEKLVSIEYLRSFRWDVNLNIDEEYCNKLNTSENNIDWIKVLNEVSILVNNLEITDDKITVSYVIPKTFEKVDSVDLMRTLMLPCFNGIETILKDEEENIVFNIVSELTNECDWHLSFPSDSYDCLKILVSYEVANHSIF